MIETCLNCGKQIGRGEAKETDQGYICCNPEECIPPNLHAALGEHKPVGKKQYPFRVVQTADVTLIAKTHYDDVAVDRWCQGRGMKFETDAEADGDAIAEFSGRACYLSFNQDRRRPCPEGEQNSTYLAHIREVGHGSVTEHAYWTFMIDDFSKNCTQELVRHRVGVAFSIQSSRYVDQFSNEYFGDSGHSLGVYVPPEVQADEELFAEWLEIWKSVVVTYNRTFLKLRASGHDKKTARSIARHIIPGSMCNAVVFTVNARELNHIFAMRGSLPADPEIRRMTMRLWDHVKNDNLFAGWEEVQDEKHGRYLKPKGDIDGMLAKLLDRDPQGFNEAMRKIGFGPRPRPRPQIDLNAINAETMHGAREGLQTDWPGLKTLGLGTHAEDTNELMIPRGDIGGEC